jgi:hypothetical protein
MRALVASIASLAACGRTLGPPPAVQFNGGVQAGAQPSVPVQAGAQPSVPATAESSGAVSPCEGASLDLLAVIADRACRISEAEADRLRKILEDPARTSLRVDADVRNDQLVQMSIVNTGNATATLPLLVHSHLDTFPALAGSLTLEPAQPAWPANISFETGRTLVRLVLPPGARAFAKVQLEFAQLTVVSSDLGKCPPDAKCAPQKVVRGPLPPGTYTLRLRTPLYAIREDLEARVRWQTKP